MKLLKERITQRLSEVPPYIKALVSYGLLIGLLNALYLYLMVLTPIGTIPYIGYTKLLFLALDIFLLVKVLKVSRSVEKKYIDQVIVGTVMFGIAGLLFSCAVYFLTQVLRPELLVQQREAIFQSISEIPNRSDDEKQKLREQYERQLQQPQFSVDQFTGMTSNGLIYSLVVAIFIRHKVVKDKDKETNTEETK